MLSLDGFIQSSSLDEHVYHETLAHVPLLSLSDAYVRSAVESESGGLRVFIGGGGEGLLLREVEHAFM